MASRAFFAAMRASAERLIFLQMRSPSFGCFSRYSAKHSYSTLATSPSTSGLVSFTLVCDSKLGFGWEMLMTAVSPSRKSLPIRSSDSLKCPFFFP